MNRNLVWMALATALLFAPHAAGAAGSEDYSKFLGAPPPSFADADALVEEFKARLAADDEKGFAALLGLNADEAVKQDGFSERFGQIQDAASEKIAIEEDAADHETILLGNKVWPFPFPMVQTDGKWAFDPEAGLDEVVSRRIGQNELETIATVRGYVAAQETYRANDWDGDGVLEYAQKLVSTPGKFDGLYWPPGAGAPDSPAGPLVSQSELNDKKDGYFGYRYKILTGQGDNIDGGKQSYLTNGNMIGGFALVAWPVAHDRTGVMTFVVNQYGTVYEKDLGEDTEKLAGKIESFNPDESWTIVSESTQ